MSSSQEICVCAACRRVTTVLEQFATTGRSKWQEFGRDIQESWSSTQGRQYHLVGISLKAYHSRGSFPTAQEAANATYTAHKQSRSMSFVMRDGTTGKRYSVWELVVAGLVCDRLLDSRDRILIAEHKRLAEPGALMSAQACEISER